MNYRQPKLSGSEKRKKYEMNSLINLISENAVMANMQYAIILPVIAGLILFAIPDKASTLKGIAALLVAVVAGILTTGLCSSGSQRFIAELWDAGKYLTLRLDNLSR